MYIHIFECRYSIAPHKNLDVPTYSLVYNIFTNNKCQIPIDIIVCKVHILY